MKRLSMIGLVSLSLLGTTSVKADYGTHHDHYPMYETQLHGKKREKRGTFFKGGTGPTFGNAARQNVRHTQGSHRTSPRYGSHLSRASATGPRNPQVGAGRKHHGWFERQDQEGDAPGFEKQQRMMESRY